MDSYPPAKRALLREHLQRALARLRDRSSQLEVAAAINAYVFLRPILRRRLPELAAVPAGRAAPIVGIPFTARGRRMRIRVSGRGMIKLQAVGLR